MVWTLSWTNHAMDSWTPVLKIDAEAEINRYWFVSVDIHEPYLENMHLGLLVHQMPQIT